MRLLDALAVDGDVDLLVVETNQILDALALGERVGVTPRDVFEALPVERPI